MAATATPIAVRVSLEPLDMVTNKEFSSNENEEVLISVICLLFGFILAGMNEK
jgi:hypothetical protein